MNINLDTFVCTKGTANHQRAVEMLGAFRKGWQPATADREGQGVADYKILALPWIATNTDYWWMFDSRMKNDRYGLQYKESEAINLAGPNIVFKLEHLLWETIIEQFRKFRETLEFLFKTILSKTLLQFAFADEI